MYSKPQRYAVVWYHNAKSKRRISEQARIDLDDYVTSFDHTRTLRRRISMQSSDDEKPSRKFIKSTKKR